jgi:hypothetical protein
MTTEHTETDCRSADGVTVGLIDAIITAARVLANRNLDSPAVHAALVDLRDDEDVLRLLGSSSVRSGTPTTVTSPTGTVTSPT